MHKLKSVTHGLNGKRERWWWVIGSVFNKVWSKFTSATATVWCIYGQMRKKYSLWRDCTRYRYEWADGVIPFRIDEIGVLITCCNREKDESKYELSGKTTRAVVIKGNNYGVKDSQLSTRCWCRFSSSIINTVAYIGV